MFRDLKQNMNKGNQKNVMWTKWGYWRSQIIKTFGTKKYLSELKISLKELYSRLEETEKTISKPENSSIDVVES